MLISTALLLDSNIRNSVCTPAKLPCRRVEVGYDKINLKRVYEKEIAKKTKKKERKSYEKNKNLELSGVHLNVSSKSIVNAPQVTDHGSVV
jgi:hypothetical protein